MNVVYFVPNHNPVSISVDAISDKLENEEGLIIVDIVDPTEQDKEKLLEEFSLHPLAVEDIFQGYKQRPKLQVYPTHAFMVVHIPTGGKMVDGSRHANPQDTLQEVDVFFGSNWVVLLRKSESSDEKFSLKKIEEQFTRLFPGSTDVGLWMHVFFDFTVSGYLDVLEFTEDSLESIENTIFLDTNIHESIIQRKMLALRRELVLFRRRVAPLREVITMILRKETLVFSSESLVYFQDTLDHLLRVIDQVDTQRELLGNAIDAHLGLVSNQMNEIMKKMTSVGAILLGSTLLAGIWGMNFEHMPELSMKYGYLGALLSMVILTGLLSIYFRKKNWL